MRQQKHRDSNYRHPKKHILLSTADTMEEPDPKEEEVVRNIFVPLQPASPTSVGFSAMEDLSEPDTAVPVEPLPRGFSPDNPGSASTTDSTLRQRRSLVATSTPAASQAGGMPARKKLCVKRSSEVL